MSPTFQPAWWLPGPHLQTLWNPLCRKPVVLRRRRERLKDMILKFSFEAAAGDDEAFRRIA